MRVLVISEGRNKVNRDRRDLAVAAEVRRVEKVEICAGRPWAGRLVSVSVQELATGDRLCGFLNAVFVADPIALGKTAGVESLHVRGIKL